jgi:hypothetical protein
VIPRSQGGDLSPEDLTPACSWCNLSKGAGGCAGESSAWFRRNLGIPEINKANTCEVTGQVAVISQE